MNSKTGNFTFEVLVHGHPVREYRHAGDVFVEGRLDTEYTLRVRNNSHRRAVAVISVDGLSVMSGQSASRGDSGYIVDPYSYADVPGWRLSNVDVAHFFFGSLPQAYATRMGKPMNIGVIAATVFHEKHRQPAPVYYGAPLMRGGPMKGGGELDELAERSFGIGTGFGRRTEHQVQSVDFDREASPAAEMVIRYDDAAGLKKVGITVTAAHQTGNRMLEARPFPADEGCKPPAGWRG